MPARRIGRQGQLPAFIRCAGLPFDDHADYLHQRWAEGVTNAVQLAEEISALGYRGSVKAVRTYLHPPRTGQVPPRRRPAPPTVREITSVLLRHPDALEPTSRFGSSKFARPARRSMPSPPTSPRSPR